MGSLNDLFNNFHFFGFSGLFYLFLLSALLNSLQKIFLNRSSTFSQSLTYHYHLDTRSYDVLGISIPNFLDVATNLIFVLVGVAGVIACAICLPSKSSISTSEKAGWFIFFVGFSLVSLGSAYYHWTPNNWTLVWDRLPMTIGFMSLYYIAQDAYTDSDVTISLTGNLLLGVLSMVIWFASLFLNEQKAVRVATSRLSQTDGTDSGRVLDSHNQSEVRSPIMDSPMIKVNLMGNRDGTGMNRDDATHAISKSSVLLQDILLPYATIQFYPIIALFVMMVTWPNTAELSVWYLVPTFVLYILAKILEAADLKSNRFYSGTCCGKISGHSLKHLSAGLAAISLIVYVVKSD